MICQSSINACFCLIIFICSAPLSWARPHISEPQLGRGLMEEQHPSKLESLFDKVLAKQESAKAHKLIDFISRSVPNGVDASIPFMGEYETFRSDKSASFVNDGAGHIVFRQYRRARLSDILHSVNRRAGGV